MIWEKDGIKFKFKKKKFDIDYDLLWFIILILYDVIEKDSVIY